jgi:hypothetical protein
MTFFVGIILMMIFLSLIVLWYMLATNFTLMALDMKPQIFNSLKDNNTTKHLQPFLGVYTVKIDQDIAERVGLREAKGFIITDVIPDSPAEKAGLRGGYLPADIGGKMVTLGGDIIIAVDHRNLTDHDSDYLPTEKKIGDRLNLGILRNGKIKDIPVSLIARPDYYTYKSPGFGFEIEYPSDWTLPTLSVYAYQPSIDTTNVALFEYSNKSEPYKPNLLISVENLFNHNKPVTENTTEYEQNLAALGITPINFKLVKQNTKALLGGNDALEVLYNSETTDGIPITTTQIKSVVRDKLYTLTYTLFNDGSLSPYLPILQKMVNSFKVLFQNNDELPRPGYNTVTADYTFLIYMVASDLEAKPSYAATNDIQEMEKVGSTSKVNVIIETGGGSNKTKIDGKRFMDFTKVQRHKITKNNFQTIVNLGKKDMGDPSTLTDFITWGIDKFPAKKYVIVLWDHGSGINGFGQDKQFNNDKLDIFELEKAFTDAKIITNKNFELIGFDSCLMASIEVANSIKSFGNYMVASEEVEPSWGWNYTAILWSLTHYSSQSGSDLGITIADSFNKSSTISAAKFQNFDSQRGITLSLIDLTKIPRVVRDINALALSLKDNLTNMDAAISLIRSADMSERYGETAHGSTGMTDIYDLVSNIEEKFPHSLELLNLLKQSLKAAVVYEINGESKPHATGISIYSPISKQELTDSRVFSIGSWLELVNVQSNLTSNIKVAPTLKTYYDGQSIRGFIYNYTQQISKVNLYVRPDSSKSNLFYGQELDPSTLIYPNGTFDYKQNNKILSLCNQDRICKPTSAAFVFTKDKKYALIPVRLKSEIGNINENVSLAYELTKEGKFIFLGASPEVNPTETISKEKYPLYSSDVIYTQGYDLSTAKQANSAEQSKQLNSSDVDSIQVSNPNNFTPKYVGYNGTLDLIINFCDFSDNCAATSWYNLTNIKYSPILKDVRSYSDGFDVQTSKDIINKDASGNLITYVNPANKFRVQHPTNWTEASRTDPLALQLVPPQNYTATLQLITEYWPFEESPKAVANYLNVKHLSFYKLIESSETKIGGNNAYKILFSGISGKQRFMGILITTMVRHRMLEIFYVCDQSKFFKLLPAVEKIVNSFTFLSEQQINYLYSVRLSGQNMDNGLNLPTHKSIITFSTYNNPLYRYKIQYPSEWNLIVSQNGLTVYIRPSALSTFDLADKYVILIIGIIPNKYNMTLDTFALIGKSKIKHNFIGPNNITLNKTTISGQHAYVYTVEEFNERLQRTLKDLTTVTTIGNNFCVMEFVTPPPLFEKYISIIKKIIDSFQITPFMHTYTK